jgi:hypothetical protein
MRPGGDSGHIGFVCELTNNQKVHSAIHSLQEQGRKYGKGKADQRSRDASGGKVVMCVFHFLSSGTFCFMRLGALVYRQDY